MTREEVLHIAKLSKLDLKEEEIEKFQDQLSKIVDYISDLSKVDTKGIEPTSQTTGLKNVFREDSVKPENYLTSEEALSGKDDTYNGYFKVPAILSERTDK